MKHESQNKNKSPSTKNDVLTPLTKAGATLSEEGSVPEYAPPKPTWV